MTPGCPLISPTKEMPIPLPYKFWSKIRQGVRFKSHNRNVIEHPQEKCSVNFLRKAHKLIIG